MNDDDSPLHSPPWLTSWADVRQSGLASFYQDYFSDEWNDSWPGESRRGLYPQYLCPGYVSIWIGNFPDEETFEWYFGGIKNLSGGNYEEADEGESWCLLWDDLPCHEYYWSLRFQFFPDLLPVGQIIQELPHSENIRAVILASCEALRVDRGNAVLACFDRDYFK